MWTGQVTEVWGWTAGGGVLCWAAGRRRSSPALGPLFPGATLSHQCKMARCARPHLRRYAAVSLAHLVYFPIFPDSQRRRCE